jgi:hypothetical protein
LFPDNLPPAGYLFLTAMYYAEYRNHTIAATRHKTTQHKGILSIYKDGQKIKRVGYTHDDTESFERAVAKAERFIDEQEG